MEVSQKQLNEWRELMRRVYIGTLEVERAKGTHNPDKVNWILEALRGEVIRAIASLEGAGAQALPPPGFIFSDRSHDTPANRQYRSALWHAVSAAVEADAERSEHEFATAGIVRLLLDNVCAEIYGTPVDVASLFSEEQERGTGEA